MADLLHRLEISEAHNEALLADLSDREAIDTETHMSLASHVAELTVAEADVAELKYGRKDCSITAIKAVDTERASV